MVKLIQYLIITTTAALLIGCSTTGSSLITGITRTPVKSSEVKVYQVMPNNAELIGLVEAKSSLNWNRADNQSNALQELKKQAGLLGANGLVLKDVTASINNDGNKKGINVNIQIGAKMAGSAIYIK